MDPNAYFYGDTETDSVSEAILISEPILIKKSIPIPEPIPVPISISEPIPKSIPATDSEPAIRNRFQKTSKRAAIYSDENLIFSITNWNVTEERFV